MLVGVGHGLGAVTCVDLGEQVVDVALDGAFADYELCGDLRVRQAVAMRESTSASRGVSPSGSRGAGGRPCSCDCVGTALAMASTRWCCTAGSITASSSRTRRRAWRISFPAGVLGEIPPRAGPERLYHRLVVCVGGEDHDLRPGLKFPQARPSRTTRWSSAITTLIGRVMRARPARRGSRPRWSRW